ncbi:MAG: hypothetical protein L0Z46_12925 [Nitrospiraceae bacterium]|nr:hypothetical protein [Nitrospiraceae bacterium]
MSFRDLAKAHYKPVGYCIYCGSMSDLRREHIVPYGLSGTAVLPKATCAVCARITGQLERHVLRGPMRAVRVLRELKSRSRHQDAPKTHKLRIIRGGREEILELPLAEYPIVLHFPIFTPPANIFPEGYEHGIRLEGIVTILFGPRPEEVARRLGAESVSMPSTDKPVEFARLIGKIAYAMAVADQRIDPKQWKPEVVSSIIGEREEIGRWVGTLRDPIRKHPGLLHRIAFHEDRERNLLMGEVQLFADSETPSYGVIFNSPKQS